MNRRRNEMIFYWRILQLQVFLVAAMVGAQSNNTVSVTYSDCELKIYGCTKLVRPMLNEVRYMFPTTLSDVDTMCKMWSRFVDCVRRFMSSCSTEDQRTKFNKAVSHSMDTVHAICSSDRHQKDYLESAHCFRRVSVHSCGRYYRPLVAQVANREAEDIHICCAYGQFKSCVSAPLLRNCGIKVHALLDHSLSYLVSRCSNTFYPLSYTCPTAPPAPPMTSVITTTPLPPPPSTEPLPSTTIDSTTSLVSKPRTIIYTLPPTPGSRISSAIARTAGFLTITLFLLSMIWIHLHS